MKPRFDDRVKRPGGRRYDMGAPTDVAKTFERARRELEADQREREAKVRPMERKRA